MSHGGDPYGHSSGKLSLSSLQQQLEAAKTTEAAALEALSLARLEIDLSDGAVPSDGGEMVTQEEDDAALAKIRATLANAQAVLDSSAISVAPDVEGEPRDAGISVSGVHRLAPSVPASSSPAVAWDAAPPAIRPIPAIQPLSLSSAPRRESVDMSSVHRGMGLASEVLARTAALRQTLKQSEYQPLRHSEAEGVGVRGVASVHTYRRERERLALQRETREAEQRLIAEESSRVEEEREREYIAHRATPAPTRPTLTTETVPEPETPVLDVMATAEPRRERERAQPVVASSVLDVHSLGAHRPHAYAQEEEGALETEGREPVQTVQTQSPEPVPMVSEADTGGEGLPVEAEREVEYPPSESEGEGDGEGEGDDVVPEDVADIISPIPECDVPIPIPCPAPEAETEAEAETDVSPPPSEDVSIDALMQSLAELDRVTRGLDDEGEAVVEAEWKNSPPSPSSPSLSLASPVLSDTHRTHSPVPVSDTHAHTDRGSISPRVQVLEAQAEAEMAAPESPMAEAEGEGEEERVPTDTEDGAPTPSDAADLPSLLSLLHTLNADCMGSIDRLSRMGGADLPMPAPLSLEVPRTPIKTQTVESERQMGASPVAEGEAEAPAEEEVDVEAILEALEEEEVAEGEREAPGTEALQERHLDGERARERESVPDRYIRQPDFRPSHTLPSHSYRQSTGTEAYSLGRSQVLPSYGSASIYRTASPKPVPGYTDVYTPGTYAMRRERDEEGERERIRNARRERRSRATNASPPRRTVQRNASPHLGYVKVVGAGEVEGVYTTPMSQAERTLRQRVVQREWRARENEPIGEYYRSQSGRSASPLASPGCPSPRLPSLSRGAGSGMSVSMSRGPGPVSVRQVSGPAESVTVGSVPLCPAPNPLSLLLRPADPVPAPVHMERERPQRPRPGTPPSRDRVERERESGRERSAAVREAYISGGGVRSPHSPSLSDPRAEPREIAIGKYRLSSPTSTAGPTPAPPTRRAPTPSPTSRVSSASSPYSASASTRSGTEAARRPRSPSKTGNREERRRRRQKDGRLRPFHTISHLAHSGADQSQYKWETSLRM
ncbi:hypothetical protein KIPB_007319 [Kipferlia bialata]|uniref:Uncharacterized protein n=1 Tax=Kipferlia bialata TaxID=797122 RepID=A0A9K3GKH5_9EUKA|nr:hypothetical protein KIPB_007319 [Kipferlia bialata]|eukprot:g7319.t1